MYRSVSEGISPFQGVKLIHRTAYLPLQYYGLPFSFSLTIHYTTDYLKDLLFLETQADRAIKC